MLIIVWLQAPANEQVMNLGGKRWIVADEVGRSLLRPATRGSVSISGESEGDARFGFWGVNREGRDQQAGVASALTPHASQQAIQSLGSL